jgi:predicted RNA binding protein YcfA (HicA-like mRNA interferase family)
MPSLRRLSGAEVEAIFKQYGFERHSQRGSHVKLRRLSPEGHKQTMTLVMDDELDTGTLRAIVRQASRFIPENDLRPHFWSE